MRKSIVVITVVAVLTSMSLWPALGMVAPSPGVAPAPPVARGAAPEPAAAPVVGGEALPTMEQLNAQLAEGKHQEVLKHVAKLLGLRGEHAKTYDRYDLLCLRGEAALRGKANSMAMEAFAQASKAATDPDKQAIARATELLIRRSKPLGYVPRSTQAAPAARKVDAAAVKKANEPIPYIEPDDRKRAFAALFADEMAVVAPKVKAATNANGLPPIIDAIKSIGDLRALEVAATGSSAQTKAISGDLGAHAHQLIAGTLGPMERRVEECWQSG